jgi:hypothetical protein
MPSPSYGFRKVHTRDGSFTFSVPQLVFVLALEFDVERLERNDQS